MYFHKLFVAILLLSLFVTHVQNDQQMEEEGEKIMKETSKNLCDTTLSPQL
jgi:hypothetical protein